MCFSLIYVVTKKEPCIVQWHAEGLSSGGGGGVECGKRNLPTSLKKALRLPIGHNRNTNSRHQDIKLPTAPGKVGCVIPRHIPCFDTPSDIVITKLAIIGRHINNTLI